MYLCVFSLSLCGESSGSSIDEISKDKSFMNKTIMEYVEEGVKNIKDLSKKDVVILVGKTQVGKTTTTLSLLGYPLERDSKEKRIVPKDTSGFSRDLVGRGDGASCTDFPISYENQDKPYVFLDTRGFFDVRHNQALGVASSILTEMAIKKAKSVRLMVLADMESLSQGITGFRDLGDALGKIVIGNTVPVFFLFNKYKPDEYSAQEYYEMTVEEKQEHIQTEISSLIQKLIKAESDTHIEFTSHLYKGLKKIFSGKEVDPVVASNPEYQKSASAIRYINFLHHNEENGRFGYIDPLNANSVGMVIEHLKKLPPIDKSSLVFSGYDDNRIRFEEAFLEQTSTFRSLLKAKSRMSKYSLSLLEELLEEARLCEAHHIAVSGAMDVYSQYITLKDAYTVSQKQDKKNIKDKENEKNTLVSQRQTIANEIIQILNGADDVYLTKKWKEESGFFSGWWRNYTYTYTGAVPYTKRKSDLKEGTSESGCKENTEKAELEVSYTSSIGYDCAGEISIYVSPKNNPTTKELLKTKDSETKALDNQIDTITNKIAELKDDAKKNLDDNLIQQIKHKQRKFAGYIKYLAEAIDYRELIDKKYDQTAKKIESAVNIANRLENDKPNIKELREEYPIFLKSIANERTKLEETFIDQTFSSYLLDPVELVCDGNGHSQPYERHNIVKQLKDDNKRCPTCRKETSIIRPMDALAKEMENIIDEIYSDTIHAKSMME